MLLRHHAEDVAHTSDTSTLSKQFSVPAQEREQVEAKGYGSFMGPYSVFEHGQLLLSVHPAWSFQPVCLSSAE